MRKTCVGLAAIVSLAAGDLIGSALGWVLAVGIALAAIVAFGRGRQ